MEKRDVIFQLSDLLEYSAKGDFHKAGSITLHAPSMGCFEEASELAQLVAKAFAEVSRANAGGKPEEIEEDKKEEKLDAYTVRMILFSSSTVSFVDISKRFNKLSKKTCEIDKGVFFNKDTVTGMDIDDYIDLICEYISNFTLPSLLSAREGSDPKKTGSK